MRHDWDATTYDRVSAPQVRWGGPVAARLPLAGDEVVLDAGCGTGRVTEAPLKAPDENGRGGPKPPRRPRGKAGLPGRRPSPAPPGGRLEAQCGGRGNIASVVRALERVAPGEAYPYTFATADETAGRLEAAGFTEVETWLAEERTPFPDRAELESFLATVVLWPQLEVRDPAEHAAFVARVADELPATELDYVRLNLRAKRR